MSTLERAIAIAAAAHEGVRDKGGHPYILHPLRVMLAVWCLSPPRGIVGAGGPGALGGLPRASVGWSVGWPDRARSLESASACRPLAAAVLL